MILRPARPADAPAITAIYAHHVAHGTATFDTEPPAVAAMAARIAAVTGAGWPWLVAERQGELLGYAYAAQLRDRPAYRHTAEDSIYIAPGEIGRGIGRALLAELLAAARAADFRQMIAVIGDAAPASVALHRSLGFREVGRWHDAGWKFGRWCDVVHMQKAL